MRLVILGATGGIGRNLVTKALAAGHDVTAVVRDPDALPVRHERLDVRVADVRDPEALAPVVKGADAVLSALGSRPPVKGPVSLLTDAARATLEAMREAGVYRLLTVSAAGAYTEPNDGLFTRWFVKPLLGRLLRYGFADTREADRVVCDADVDWTIVRPPMLTDKPGTGRYRVGDDNGLKRSYTVPRADVADYMLRAAGDRETYHHAVVVAN